MPMSCVLIITGLYLAEQHSKAVDFPKTGDPVRFSQKSHPRMWPHFMGKRNSYKSRKALGVLYDKVVQQRLRDFSPDWSYKFDERILKRYDLSHELLDKARAVKAQYDISVRRILTQQSLKTEFELWSTFSMSRTVGTTEYKRQEDLGHEYDVLKQRFRNSCYEAAGGKTADVIDPFVAAMYTVTAQDAETILQEKRIEQIEDYGNDTTLFPLEPSSAPLISFPWIFHWVLIRIALGEEYSTQKSRLARAKRA
jgi:RNA-dependent RNA polymerase